jgi:sulfopyruvate decarboxylase TPP-binding subunit
MVTPCFNDKKEILPCRVKRVEKGEGSAAGQWLAEQITLYFVAAV